MNALPRLFGFLPVVALFLVSVSESRPAAVESPIKVLVVTGGHDFMEKEFYSLFQGYGDLMVDRLVQPKANAAFGDGSAMAYDVVVLYDMWEQISDAEKQGFLKYLDAGKGLVALHHCLASYQAWPPFMEIIGGTYQLSETPRELGGKMLPQSTYKHDQDLSVKVVDTEHPITRGIRDFTIHDETYGGFYVLPDVHPLLTTDHPLSSPVIAWTKPRGPANVAYIQLGHDAFAFNHPNYRRLVVQAIRWAAKQPTPVALFNGRDSTGWESEGNARWSVENGILTGRQGENGEAGDLLTSEVYGDFELTAEFKMVWPGNSGVWFRYQNADKAYQADILEWKDPVCWSGSVYCTGKMFIALNPDPSIVKKEDWNTFVVRSEGDHLQVWLNGVKTADLHDETSDRGRIGFQVHQGDEFKNMAISLRNVEILPLGTSR